MSAIPTYREHTGNPTPPADGDWTVDEYMRLENPPGFRYELIEGHLFMSPSPNYSHQSAIGILHELMSAFARKNKLGVVPMTPFDVVLSPVEKTVVQPDIVFVSRARRSIIRGTHVEGAPDLVVEAVSPKRERIDRDQKFRAYAEAGVMEYWIVDPPNRQIEVWVRRGDALVDRGRFGAGMHAPCEAIPGFSASVDEVFSDQ